MKKLGIIGTAGRGEDEAKLTPEVWKQTKRGMLKFIQEHGIEEVVSGGAAYMDHMAVMLFIKNKVNDLTLHLPCRFDTENDAFIENGFKSAGSTSNYYHRKFSKAHDIDSLAQITLAIKEGAHVKIGDGFFDRNNVVAQEADILIAFTFGDGAILKDGGTAHTMKKYHSLGKKESYHFDLHNLMLYKGAKTE